MKHNERILVHVCCAPCSTTVMERLQEQAYDIVLFFSNSNIHPEDEYLKRLEEARNLAAMLSLVLVEDPYNHAAWLTHIHGLESEPEQGKRCLKCFEYNLARASAMAQELNIPGFTTTLTVSRHKSSKDIFAIGSTFPGFLPMDFKKQDGFNRSIQLSSQLNLYRQDYCGCEFSKNKAPDFRR
jgi:epoxyqueuosine reductase